MKFEIWLSGSNKQIQVRYWNILKSKNLKNYFVPGTLKGSDSIVEFTLAENPDFSDTEALKTQIENGAVKFIKDISELLKEC